MDVLTGLLLICLGYGGCHFLSRKKVYPKYKLERAEEQAEKFFEEAKGMFERELEELLKGKEEYPLGEDEWKDVYKAESEALGTLEKLRKVFIRAKERMRYEPYEKQAQLFDDWLELTHINSRIWLSREALKWAPDNKVADSYRKSIEEDWLVRDELERRLSSYLK